MERITSGKINLDLGVCVCAPLRFQEFDVALFTLQGAHESVPGVSQRSSRFGLGYRKRTLFRRTCPKNCCPRCPFLGLLPWSFLMLFPKTGFLGFTAAHRRVLQTSEQIVQQFSCADRFTFRFPQDYD